MLNTSVSSISFAKTGSEATTSAKMTAVASRLGGFGRTRKRQHGESRNAGGEKLELHCLVLCLVAVPLETGSVDVRSAQVPDR